MSADRQQGAAAASLVGWHLYRRRSKTKSIYGELHGAVSFSSRLVAALRALEDQEGEGALFSDPLAGLLAGRDAVRQAEAYAQVWGVAGRDGQQEAAGAAPADAAQLAEHGRKYLAGRLAVRTWWFDTKLEAALRRAGGGGGTGSGKRRLQVVVLGAGMDTRPWRHNFLRGVDWIEVDRADVLAAKDAALEREGAQPRAGAAGDWRFPLLAGSRVTLEADLNGRDWLQTLQAAGFDPQSPTVWIAEGLLMYLQPAAVAQLLETTAGSSAPGSTLLTQAFVRGYSMREQASVRQKPHIYRELQSTFTWFCEPDPAPFFRQHGWRQPEVTGYARMAAATGKPAEIITSECAPGGLHDKMCPFIQAHI